MILSFVTCFSTIAVIAANVNQYNNQNQIYYVPYNPRHNGGGGGGRGGGLGGQNQYELLREQPSRNRLINFNAFGFNDAVKMTFEENKSKMTFNSINQDDSPNTSPDGASAVGGVKLNQIPVQNDRMNEPSGSGQVVNSGVEEGVLSGEREREEEEEMEDEGGGGGGVDSQQPANNWEGNAVPEAPCDRAGAEVMTVETLCSLPPHKGTGNDDIFRYYYNPVVQQCIPFSYSGKGGNANRFVSVKNCYEICHPADPTVKKPRVVSGIRAYLVPNLKSNCPKPQPHPRSMMPKEVVVRQMPHPLDASKTLTIVQNTRYVPQSEAQLNRKSNYIYLRK